MTTEAEALQFLRSGGKLIFNWEDGELKAVLEGRGRLDIRVAHKLLSTKAVKGCGDGLFEASQTFIAAGGGDEA